MINHNKNVDKEIFEKRMETARGELSSPLSEDIVKERTLQRLSLWENRLLPSYRNIKIEKDFFRKVIENKLKSPVRLMLLKSTSSYQRKMFSYKIAKCLIIDGYSSHDIEIVDSGLLLNSQLDWEDKSSFYKRINNSNIKMMIITEVPLTADSNIRINEVEMFWTRIKKLLSDNPNMDMIIISADSTKKIALPKEKQNFSEIGAIKDYSFTIKSLVELKDLFNFIVQDHSEEKKNRNILNNKDDVTLAINMTKELEALSKTKKLTNKK